MIAGSSLETSWPLSAADAFHAELDGSVLASIHHLDRSPDPILLGASLEAVIDRFPYLACRILAEPSPRLERVTAFRPETAIEFRPVASSLDFVAEASRIYTTPFFPDCPPWRIVILTTKTPAPAWLAVLCVHHTLLDGIGMRDFLKALHAAADPRGKRKELVRDASVDDGWARSVETMRRIASSIVRELKVGAGGGALGLVQGASSGGRALTVVDLPRTPLRTMCRAAGVGVVPALLVLVGDALARYADATPVSRPLRMMVPQAVEHRGAHRTVGNEYAPIIVAVPVSDLPPAQRIKSADHDRHAALAGAPLELSKLQMTLLAKMPRRLRHFCYRRWAASVDLICSILPSDVEGMQLGGARVTCHYGFAPLPAGQGLSVTILCVPEYLRLGLLTDTAIIAAPQRLVDALRAAYANLVLAVRS